MPSPFSCVRLLAPLFLCVLSLNLMAQAPSDVDALQRALHAFHAGVESDDPEVFQKLQQKREKALKDAADKLRGIGGLRRGLMLQEWVVDPRAPGSKALEDVREGIAKKLENQLRAVFKDGDSLSQLAAVNLIGEISDPSSANPLSAALARRLTPDLLKQLKGDDADTRAASARALGRIGADPKEAVPALEGLLQKGTPAERRAAAEGLGFLLKHARAKAQNGEVDQPPASITELATALVPAGGRGLSDDDAEVRRHCHTLLDQAAEVLVEELGDVSSLPVPAGRGDVPPVPLNEQRKEYQNRLKRTLPLQRTLAAQIPALLKNTKAEELATVLSAYQTLEAVAQSRLGLNQRVERIYGDEKPAAGTFEDLLIPGLRRAVPDLAAGLSHKEVRVQLASLYVLESLKAEAAPAAGDLAKALDSQEPFVRWGAARVVRHVAPREADRIVPALARRLDDENADVRLTSLLALKEYGPAIKPAVEALAKALAHKDTNTRAFAVEVVASAGTEGKAAAPALLGALADSDSNIRVAAIEALPRLGPLTPRARLALRKALSDAVPTVRQAAAEALLADK
jgi:HEAT repeat protein